MDFMTFGLCILKHFPSLLTQERATMETKKKSYAPLESDRKLQFVESRFIFKLNSNQLKAHHTKGVTFGKTKVLRD